MMICLKVYMIKLNHLKYLSGKKKNYGASMLTRTQIINRDQRMEVMKVLVVILLIKLEK